MTNYAKNKLLELKVDKTVELLKSEIQFIPDVQTWASVAGFSREWLYKSIKIIHDLSPKVILREIRYEKIIVLIKKKDINASCYCVAVESGLKDGKALSKFLSNNFNTNFTILKQKVLKGNEHYKYRWLDNNT